MTKKLHYKFHDSAGDLFEEEITESLSIYAAKTWGKGSLLTSSMVEDQHFGKDFTLLGIPVDVTLNYEGKRNMKRVGKTISLNVGKVQFGVRFGNGRVKFEEPVLVVGFDMDVYKGNYKTVVSLIKDHFSEIFETGMDLYWETVEA